MCVCTVIQCWACMCFPVSFSILLSNNWKVKGQFEQQKGCEARQRWRSRTHSRCQMRVWAPFIGSCCDGKEASISCCTESCWSSLWCTALLASRTGKHWSPYYYRFTATIVNNGITDSIMVLWYVPWYWMTYKSCLFVFLCPRISWYHIKNINKWS